MPDIGVLALQGDVAEHARMLARAGANPVLVKHAEQLDQIDGLIIPGGESTTIGKLLRRFEMLAPLRARIENGMPVYGTCAGMILLANKVEDAAVDQPTLGAMNITVRRNAFGRQRDSFETDVNMPAVGDDPMHAVFIRAPLITNVHGDVDVLARLPDGRIVAAREGQCLVSSFHPELTDDDRMHQLFTSMVAEHA